MIFLDYLIIINIIGLFMCYIDKLFAVKHFYRIPEFILLFVCLVGGCYGFEIGMNLFHHKTKKIKFKIVYIFCFVWLIILYKIYVNIY